MQTRHAGDLDPQYYPAQGNAPTSVMRVQSPASPFGYFALGTAVGFVAGILLARRSGAELRAQLSESAAGALDKVKQQTSRFVPTAVRDRVRTSIEAVRSKASRTREPRPSESAAREEAPHVVDLLNEASKDDLIAVNGIGPVLADRIIRNRPYESERELLEKDVIPQSAFEALRRELLRKAG